MWAAATVGGQDENADCIHRWYCRLRDILFEQVWEQSTPEPKDLLNLQTCLSEIIEHHTFFGAVRDTLICSIAEYLGQNVPGFSTTCIAWCVRRCSSPPLSGEFQRCSSLAPDGIRAHLRALCSARPTVRCAVVLYLAYLSETEPGGELVRIYSALRFAGQIEPDLVKACPEQHFMTRSFANCHREVAIQLVLASETTILLSVSTVHKLAHSMLHFFQQKRRIVAKH
jgi:hypothetical protein